MIMETSEGNTSNTAGPDSPNQAVDITFLPLVYEIIRSLERDPHDPAQKNVQLQDVSQKVLEIQNKLGDAREKIRRLPGIEFNKREQKHHMKNLRNRLKLKRNLLLNFRNLYSFDGSKP